MKEFRLVASDYIQLCDLLKRMSLCQSGGQAKMFIKEGLVKVNGEVELRKRFKLRVGHIVEFESNQIKIIS